MADKEKKKDRKIAGFKEFDSAKYIELEPTIDEAAGATAVVAWGRMNPMTAGHEKLVNKVISVAKSEKGIPHVFLTHTVDKKKNPLGYEDKINFAQKALVLLLKNQMLKLFSN
jgi:hypothetical protein